MQLQGQQPVEVAVELERARRLGDRFGKDESECSELAREQRAHRVSAEFVKSSVASHLSASCMGGFSAGISQLEHTLEDRRRDHLKTLTSAESQQSSMHSTKESAVKLGIQAVVENPQDVALRESLDDISVKSLLDFRTAGEGILSAEAIATAAACAIANLDEVNQISIHSIDPDRPWPDALQLLSKPGHFINSLRRFPFAVQAGIVPEDNMVAARHFLSMAQDAGDDKLHPAVSALQRWVSVALDYWGDDSTSQSAAARLTPSTSPPNHRAADGTTQQCRSLAARQNRRGAASPGAQARSIRCSTNTQPDSQPAKQAARSPVGPKPVPSSSCSSRAAATLHRPRSPDLRHAQRQVASGMAAPKKAEATPRARTPAPSSSASRARSARSVTASATQPVSDACSASRRSLSRHRNAERSPRPSTVSPGRSQSRPAASSTRSLVPCRSASSIARSSNNVAGQPLPTAALSSVEDLKRLIEETKKEVRQIRSLEAKTKWDLSRQERRDKNAETVAAQSELREWRWKQADSMKAHVAAKARQSQERDLRESKEHVGFKREVKVQSKEVEQQHQAELYAKHKEDAAWNVARSREEFQQEQILVKEKVENVLHLRQHRHDQKQQLRAEEERERAQKEHLEIAHMARELAQEKQRLLQSLELTRSQIPLRPAQ
eukprot:TRINITY_DN87266_c0_g1_i1.p1 TRINITY_DN87266_c0_g1~~TRINITY_DN87266_c0_g1_i1.p1  ORF type:complete len:731 (-),score=135.35 TRINITY_DN87266_c0_g1_i1:117-2114(-)